MTVASPSAPPAPASPLRRALPAGLAGLGATAVITQMLVLRGLLSAFGGNELTLGVILSVWLLLSGAGCALGRRSGGGEPSAARWIAAQVAVGLLPLLSLLALPLLTGIFVPGRILGLGEVFEVALLSLAPFCLTSGWLLTRYAGALAGVSDSRSIGRSYVLDTLGGVAGGALFSFLLVHRLRPFEVAWGLLLLNLAVAWILARAGGVRRARLALPPLLLVAASLAATTDLDGLAAGMRFPGLEVERSISTPYQQLCVTRRGDELSVFGDGQLLGSTGDVIAAEESVHYALAQHPDPRRVLLVSGGLSGAHVEVARYPVESIEYVELDPAVLDLVRELGGADDPRLALVEGDARAVIRRSPATYDAILLSLPDPSTAQLNRYYTAEFFAEARRALRDGGVLGFGLSGAENYAGPELTFLASSVHAALAESFSEILLVPGERLAWVAAERALSFEAIEGLAARGIETRFVRPEFLEAKITPDRREAAAAIVSAPAEANRDFRPGAYHAHLLWWLNRFGGSLTLPALLALGLLLAIAGLVAGARSRAIPIVLGSSGFAGLGLEVVILIAFQIVFGHVYRDLGAIITSFLLGAAIGAAIGGAWSHRRAGSSRAWLLATDLALAGCALLMAAAPRWLGAGDGGGLHPLLFAAANGVVGLLVGAQFPAAARRTFTGVERTAGEVFAADLFGAALGALLVGAFAIPLLGIPGTCLAIGGAKLASAAWLLVGGRRRTRVPERGALGSRRFAFGAMLLVLVAIGVTIASEDTATAAYDLSFSETYQWLVLAFLAAGLALAVGVRPPIRWRGSLRAIQQRTGMRLFQWGSFLALSLLVFYPLFRCYFTVPYLFCHVCPRKCIFGFMRPYLIPAALVMNVQRKTWCLSACPIGIFGQAEGRAASSARRPGRILRWLPIPVVAFVAYGYFRIRSDSARGPEEPGGWYTYFYENVFVTSTVVVAVTAALIGLGLLLRRPFCETLCPVGRCSQWIHRIERAFTDRGRPPGRREARS